MKGEKTGKSRVKIHPSFSCSLAFCSAAAMAVVGQSVELSLVSDMQLEGFVFLEQVLRELQGEHACLLGELAQLLLAFLIEQGTAAYKTIIACIEQHLFLGIQLAVGMVVYELDAFEEFLVQGDIVGMLGKDGAHLLCQGFHLVAGLCAHHA